MTRVTSASALLALMILAQVSAAQEVTLQNDCERGFREVIQMAQAGALGADVTNANVRVDGKHVELDLVRADGSLLSFRLGPKASAQAFSRYFDIALAAGAEPADAARVGRALNDAFDEDPFVIVASEGGRGDDPIPGIIAAWGYGGWQGVARVVERRMMVLATVRYTGTVVAILLIGLAGCVALLWLSPVPRRP